MERYPEWTLGVGSRIKAEALRGLFQVARRVQSGRRGPFTEQAEFHHTHTASYHWNESYYFNFTDPMNKVGGFTRIGMVPNQKTAIGILFLFLEDGSIEMLTQSEPAEASRDEVQVGLLRYERIRPLWEWRIAFQGRMLHLENARMLLKLLEGEQPGDLGFHEVSVGLVFRGWSPCHDFKDMDLRAFAERVVAKGSRIQDLRAISKVASEHYEQVGACTGEIEIEGRSIPFVGSGHRDHSWGDRDWKAPSKWTWLTSQFDGTLGFNLSRVVIKSVDVINGFISRGGRNYSIRRAHLETEFEADGLTQKRIFLRLQDISGWDMEVVGTPLTVVPLVRDEAGHRTLVNEAFTEYRWKNHIGYGIAEYLHQLA